MKKLLQGAEEFENEKMKHMSMSDRVASSRKAKRLILAINEIYKKSEDPKLMSLMKRLTKKKQKIETRLKGRSTS